MTRKTQRYYYFFIGSIPYTYRVGVSDDLSLPGTLKLLGDFKWFWFLDEYPDLNEYRDNCIAEMNEKTNLYWRIQRIQSFKDSTMEPISRIINDTYTFQHFAHGNTDK